MHKIKVSIAPLVAVVLVCFALGVFDGDGVSKEYGIDYNEFAFSGHMKNGRFTGYGLIHFYDGENYNGTFADGRFDGEGSLHNTSEQWSFDGAFHDGKVDSGTFHVRSGEAIQYERGESSNTLTAYDWSYEGEFNERGQSGTGSFTLADGSVYTGSFSSGLANGQGTYTDASGSIIYIGGFADGLFEGHGSYFSLEGWSYEGGFKGGQLHGEGVITTDTEMIRGIWEEGVQTTRYE